ncbi:MAG: FKBP-type peptidyl-prolyl cis-trans isomerase [Gemmatimonadales bacterium]
MFRTLRLPALLLAAVTACSSTDSPLRDAQVIETTTFAPALGVNLAASTKLPSGMYIRDITVGTGADVAAGQNVSMRYTGAFSNGTQFDANTSGAPFSFRLGAGQVIAGWDQGVVGMKVGGVRQLIIPSSLGYGRSDYGPIPGGSILVFSVTVVSVP